MNIKLNRENIANNLFSKKSSKQVLMEALKDIKPTKETISKTIIICFISIIISLIIAISPLTISLLSKVVGIINGVMLTIFGVVFTGYAFFQALISPNLLKRLMGIEKDGKSYFSISNDYFLNLMVLNIFAIFINIIFLIFTKIIPSSWCLFNNIYINDILAMIIIFVYLYFEIIIIWEIKSFIFNIYQLFNAAAGQQVIDMLDQDKDNNN